MGWGEHRGVRDKGEQKEREMMKKERTKVKKELDFFPESF